MKIITLNTWGGRAGKEKLLDFFRRHNDTDIFCLQEIWSAAHKHLEGVNAGGRTLNHEEIMVNGMQETSALLSEHNGYFRPHFGDNYGLMTLIKKSLKVVEEGDVFVYQHKGYTGEGDIGNHARNIQYATIRLAEGLLTIINFHGLWNGGGKGDSSDRINQTDNIISFLRNISNPYILCGDFNLLPDTVSLRKFEDFGLKNLIKEYGVTSTRTNFYTKNEKFADYIFVSDGIRIDTFKVLPDEVSDHSPLELSFNLNP